jgi:CheY-like chemotaxis protein
LLVATPTVLVVDDDPDVRDSVVDVLQAEGYVTLAAGNGLEALRLLRDSKIGPPDVILLDLLMPVMDGWTFLAERLKQPTVAAIPVIIMSAYGAPHESNTALANETFLKKPVELATLLQEIERVVTISPS